MPLILGGSAPAAPAFSIDNSCRFNQADGAKLSKTFSTTPTDRDTWTFSTWLKIGEAEEQGIFWAEEDASNYTFMGLESSGKFTFYGLLAGGASPNFKPSLVFRDFGAWYHFVIAWDSGQAVAANRIKFYVNGTLYTGAFDTEAYPAQDADSSFNGDNLHEVAAKNSVAAKDYNGYMAETVFIDGTAYAASDFGEFDEDSPTIWVPKRLSGLTFGTNGFYLDYGDSADLGADVSGTSNDFTSTNLAAVDQCTDTPSNNFATLNSLENFWAGAAFSEGNTTVVTVTSNYAPLFSTIGMTAGKWYCEVIPTAAPTPSFNIGIASTQNIAINNELGNWPNDWAYESGYGNSRNNDTGTSYGDTYAVDDIISIALDLDNNKLYFAKNGTWQNSGVPTSGATGTGALSITAVGSTPRGAYFFAVSFWGDVATFATNFGNPPYTVSSGNADADGYGNFEYAVPSGYYALNTKNLGAYGG